MNGPYLVDVTLERNVLQQSNTYVLMMVVEK